MNTEIAHAKKMKLAFDEETEKIKNQLRQLNTDITFFNREFAEKHGIQHYQLDREGIAESMNEFIMAHEHIDDELWQGRRRA